MQIIRFALMWFFGTAIVANALLFLGILILYPFTLVEGDADDVGIGAMLLGGQILAVAFFWLMFSKVRGAYKWHQAQKAKRQESKRIFARMEARRKETE